LKRFKVFWNFT